MNKENYLKDINVENFVSYLSKLLIEIEFIHTYNNWKCNSLLDAKNTYLWNGKNYAANERELTEISDNLRKYFSENNEKEVLRYCIKTLNWGGVQNGAHGIVELYLDNNLINCIQHALAEMSKKEVCLNNFLHSNQNKNPYRMNASFTKIYSLLSNSTFIIYDSRVSAALQLIAKKFWTGNRNIQAVFPEELSFAALEGRAKNANRNASDKDKNIIFPQLNGPKKEYNHAKWNVRANWIIEAALSNIETFSDENNPLKKARAVEASLFMIGYHV